jgi:DNA-directed RNA polymerase specialized sigma24 family protein
MSSKRKGTAEPGSRGVLAQLDARLAELDGELERTGELMAERRRLVAARAALTGERVPASGSLVRRVTQEEVAAYLAEHPGSRAATIARDMGVPLTNISQHLHRGRETRFERRADGWHRR